MTIICLIVGGEAILKILQTLSIASAFPYMFVIIFMAVSMAIALKNDPAVKKEEAPVLEKEAIPQKE